MTATSVPRNRLLAQSDREFDLWQACHEFAEKSSKIVPLGAPLQSCTVRRDPLQNVPKTSVTLLVQSARPSESRKPDDLLYFDDVIVDPFKYLSESEFSTGDRTHHEFESRDRVDGQVESINKKKRVCGRKGCALVSVDKRVVVRQRFHESRRFLRHAVVIASLRAEYCGFQQTSLSNTIDPTVLIDLLFVDCENFGDGEVYTL
jgi:hypothetical protein